jgi:uncharacterized protein (TIGR03083 family)
VTLDREFYLARLEEDVRAMVAAAERTDLDAPVPSCPGWSLADLLQHTAEVYYNWDQNVSRRAVDRADLEARPAFESAPREQLVEQLRLRADRLIATLAATPLETPVWNWSSTQPKTVAFVPRRMAHETSVHRWDAQAAAGATGPIDADLAADGVDEFFFVHLPEETAPAPEPGTLHLHRTDGPGEWLVRMGPDGVSVTTEHAHGDAAVRASASDLVLMLWRRIPASGLETHGDTAVVERFVNWVDLT